MTWWCTLAIGRCSRSWFSSSSSSATATRWRLGSISSVPLLTRLLEVEKDRWEFKRAVTRMRNGKQPHREVSELQSGRDPADIATWRFEHDVCERLARQLRSVGDALAWRVFGFHRPFI